MDYKTCSVETNGFTMDYLQFGSGSKFFVILPGLGVQSALISAPVIVNRYAAFADEYTVCLFDRRNDPPQGYKVQNMADDTAAAMKALNMDGAYVLGVSLGGMIALNIAADHPELIEKLVLGSSTLCVDDKHFELFREWCLYAERREREKLCLTIGEKVFSKNVFSEFKDAFRAMAQTVTDDELGKFLIIARGMQGFDLRDRADRISCPVLSTGDTEDQIFGGDIYREIIRYMGSHPGFESKLYSGYGHAAYDFAPDFGKNMMEFFRDK